MTVTTHAVIGTGYWGTNHVRVAAELAATGDIDELLLCDVAEERVANLAESYDVEYVTDHAELASAGVDTAVVATPSTTHHGIATDLLAAGVDLLVEKPLALTSEDAWNIVDAAREHDRTLAAGHIFRFHPALSELRRRVERGELGQLKYLSTNRYAFREPRETTGALYSLAVHDLDIYTMLLGRRPDTIHCRLDRHLRPDVDETASLLLGYEEPEATGVIEESWQVPAFGKRRDLVAVGTERAAYIDYLADTELELFDAKVVRDGDRLRPRDEGSTTYEVEGYEPLKSEVEDFLTAARTGREPGAPGRIGAETVELLEYAERSDRRGETVRLD